LELEEGEEKKRGKVKPMGHQEKEGEKKKEHFFLRT